MEWYHWFEQRVLGGLGSAGCYRWAALAIRMRKGEVSAFVLSVLEKMVLRNAPEPVVQDFEGEMVWGVQDESCESCESETWAYVDYLDTRYPKTWFVARRMLTVTTGG